MKCALPVASTQDFFQLGQVASQSGIFGEVNPATGTMIMMTCYQNNISPLEFVRLYDVVQGKIAKKSKVMLCEFVQAGGRYKIETYTDTEVTITFAYLGNTQTISATITDMVERGIAIGKGGKLKDNWQKHPRRMLFARCVSEGVGIVCPAVNIGIYTPEEVADFTPANVPLPVEEDAPTPNAEEPTVEAPAQSPTQE